MIDFYIKKGDILPVLHLTLKDANGDALDLTGATVQFNYRLRFPQGDVTTRDADIYDASNGVIEYYWEANDTATPGLYSGEFVVLFDGTEEMTLPAGGQFLFEIIGDIS